MIDFIKWFGITFANDGKLRFSVIAGLICILIPFIIRVISFQKPGWLFTLFFAAIGLGLILAGLGSTTVTHIGEHWDPVICEYVVDAPIIAYAVPADAELEMAESIKQWYMETDMDMTMGDRRDLVAAKMMEEGLLDADSRENRLSIDSVSSYLYWQKWLKDMDEYLDRRYAEECETRTESLYEKAQGIRANYTPAGYTSD